MGRKHQKYRAAHTTIVENHYKTCTHIKAAGGICGSPALKDHNHCYFHNRELQRRRNFSRSIAEKARLSEAESVAFIENLDLPIYEDADAIQVALANVGHAIATNRIDPRKGALLLYSLQIAANNVVNTTFAKSAKP